MWEDFVKVVGAAVQLPTAYTTAFQAKPGFRTGMTSRSGEDENNTTYVEWHLKASGL
jgi:hypothetical protein